MLGIDGTGPTLVRRLLDTRPTTTRIVAWGADRRAAGEVVGQLGERAASPADLAARSTVVLVEAPGPEDLSNLLTGPLGLQAGVHSPTRLVVTTAAPTDQVRELALRVQYQTAGLLRLVHAAFPDDLGPMHLTEIAVSGSDDDFRLVAPVARLFGRPVHVGALGARACAAAST